MRSSRPTSPPWSTRRRRSPGGYPNLGPEVLVANGVTLIDETGPEVFKKVKDGARVRLHDGGVYSGDRRLALGTERTDQEIHELMHEAKSGLVAHLEAFAGNTIEFIRSESPLLIDGIGIPDIDVDLQSPARRDRRRGTQRRLGSEGPQAVHQGVPTGAGRRRQRRRRAAQGAATGPQLIVGDPDRISAEVLRCGAQVVLPADADGHAAGLERIQDLGVGAMTFPAAGSAADLALLLCRPSRRVADRHRRSHRQHRGVLRSVPPAQQPVDVPDPAQGRARSWSTPRPSPRCTAAGFPAAPSPCWCWPCWSPSSSRCGCRAPTPRCSTGSSSTGTASRCGFRAGQLGT